MCCMFIVSTACFFTLVYKVSNSPYTFFCASEKDTKYVRRLRFIVTTIQFINSVVHTYTQWT